LKDLLKKFFSFHMKFQYVLYLLLWTYQDDFEGLFEEFSTHLAVVHTTQARPTCWLPWALLISQPNTINCLITDSRLVWILPLLDATRVPKWLYHSMIEFAFGESFRIFFWIFTELLLQISLNETPPHKTLFPIESPCNFLPMHSVTSHIICNHPVR
jgi:hypothetical protein